MLDGCWKDLEAEFPNSMLSLNKQLKVKNIVLGLPISSKMDTIKAADNLKAWGIKYTFFYGRPSTPEMQAKLVSLNDVLTRSKVEQVNQFGVAESATSGDKTKTKSAKVKGKAEKSNIFIATNLP